MTEVLGIGSAIIDQILPVSEEYLETIPGEKWGSELIDHRELIQIIENSGSIPKRMVGGSAANAVKGLASLGHQCGFISKIGQDEEGIIVTRDFENTGIRPHFISIPKPTGQVVCMVTPDGKRTMRWCKGASVDLKSEDLDPVLFKNVKLVHIEGYLLYNDTLAQKAMQIAKDSGAKISFDLSSFEIVDNYRQTILDLLSSYVDILFANADEASALTHLSPEHGCREMLNLCETAVVMMGEDGCYVGHEGNVSHFPAFPVKPLDTTGAGDLFAGGFLHGWLKGESLESSAKYGALLGREIVQVVGAELPQENWKKVLPLIQK